MQRRNLSSALRSRRPFGLGREALARIIAHNWLIT